MTTNELHETPRISYQQGRREDYITMRRDRASIEPDIDLLHSFFIRLHCIRAWTMSLVVSSPGQHDRVKHVHLIPSWRRSLLIGLELESSMAISFQFTDNDRSYLGRFHMKPVWR